MNLSLKAVIMCTELTSLWLYDRDIIYVLVMESAKLAKLSEMMHFYPVTKWNDANGREILFAKSEISCFPDANYHNSRLLLCVATVLFFFISPIIELYTVVWTANQPNEQ